jgi:hypothetical protein
MELLEDCLTVNNYFPLLAFENLLIHDLHFVEIHEQKNYDLMHRCVLQLLDGNVLTFVSQETPVMTFYGIDIFKVEVGVRNTFKNVLNSKLKDSYSYADGAFCPAGPCGPTGP